MIAYWTDKRPNGQPIEAETFARVIDLEDGTNPIWTYGKTVDEVLQKIERQNGNAQLALARRATAQPNAPAQGAPTATPAAPRRRLSADEVMQLTTDLQNPAKAAAAIVKLAADETGVDPQRVAMDNFKKLAAEWEDEHEEFYQHPGNRTLLGIRAGQKVGHQVALITKEILTQCFIELLNSGQLFEAPEEHQEQRITPSPFPVESQVQRTERPRRLSTGIRGTQLRAPQTAQPKALKYSKRDIEMMPSAQIERLARDKDPDYMAACDAHFGQLATA
jgi:hypothetical protein